MYGAAAGIIYGLYFAVDHLGVNAEWSAGVAASMVVGALGGATIGAAIALARNLLVH
jgi:hypothetical protein